MFAVLVQVPRRMMGHVRPEHEGLKASPSSGVRLSLFEASGVAALPG